MNIELSQIISIFFISCIAGISSILDEFQIHRPLVICTIIGYIMNDINTGILIGGTLEMMTLGWINIGASIPPDITLASIISTILVITNKQSIGTSIAIAIPLSIGGQMLNIGIRTITIFIQHLADNFANKGKLSALSTLHVISMLLHAIRIGIPAVITVIFAKNSNILNIINSIPEFVKNGFGIAGGIIVVIGYAMIMNMIYNQKIMTFFYLGFLIAGFSNFNLLAMGILSILLAIIYIQLSPKYNKSQYENQENNKKDKILDDELD